MADWVTTTLGSGSIPSGTYTCNIPNLSASTIYEYRAYAVIDGTPYYGNILTGCTTITPTYAPTNCTGVASNITQTTMRICNNKVLNNGGLPIAEYGVLYTQVSSYGNSSCLIYSAYPAKICKKSISANISTGTSYFTSSTCELTTLASNTTTYYRAFARNAAGVGYGTVKLAQTCAIPKDISMLLYPPTQDSDQLKCCSSSIVSTPLMSAGESYSITLANDLHVDYNKDDFAYACVCIFCNGSLKTSHSVTKNTVCDMSNDTFSIDSNDVIDIETIAFGGNNTSYPGYVRAGVHIANISSISGTFIVGTPSIISSETVSV